MDIGERSISEGVRLEQEYSALEARRPTFKPQQVQRATTWPFAPVAKGQVVALRNRQRATTCGPFPVAKGHISTILFTVFAHVACFSPSDSFRNNNHTLITRNVGGGGGTK